MRPCARHRRQASVGYPPIHPGEVLREEFLAPMKLTPYALAQSCGVLRIGGVPVKRGRPKLKDAKQPVSLRLDPDVLAHFRRSGRGWQGRINAVLRKAAKLPKEKRKRA